MVNTPRPVLRPSRFGQRWDFGVTGAIVVATAGPSGYRPRCLLLAHQLYVHTAAEILAADPGQTYLVVLPVGDQSWIEVPEP